MEENNPAGVPKEKAVTWGVSSDGKAVVTGDVQMLPITPETPRGKLVLLARDGIISKGILDDSGWFTHWFPLLKIPKN